MPYVQKKFSHFSLLTSVLYIEERFIIVIIRTWFMIIEHPKIRSNYNVHQITKLDWLYLHNPAANNTTNYSHNYTVPSVPSCSRAKFKAFQTKIQGVSCLFQAVPSFVLPFAQAFSKSLILLPFFSLLLKLLPKA